MLRSDFFAFLLFRLLLTLSLLLFLIKNLGLVLLISQNLLQFTHLVKLQVEEVIAEISILV
jgi:hypothetical protein